MKKIILTLSLIAVLGTSLTSCSTDDSGLQNDTKAEGFGGSTTFDNGDMDKPKPPMRP